MAFFLTAGIYTKRILLIDYFIIYLFIYLLFILFLLMSGVRLLTKFSRYSSFFLKRLGQLSAFSLNFNFKTIIKCFIRFIIFIVSIVNSNSVLIYFFSSVFSTKFLSYNYYLLYHKILYIYKRLFYSNYNLFSILSNSYSSSLSCLALAKGFVSNMKNSILANIIFKRSFSYPLDYSSFTSSQLLFFRSIRLFHLKFFANDVIELSKHYISSSIFIYNDLSFSSAMKFFSLLSSKLVERQNLIFSFTILDLKGKERKITLSSPLLFFPAMLFNYLFSFCFKIPVILNILSSISNTLPFFFDSYYWIFDFTKSFDFVDLNSYLCLVDSFSFLEREERLFLSSYIRFSLSYTHCLLQGLASSSILQQIISFYFYSSFLPSTMKETFFIYVDDCIIFSKFNMNLSFLLSDASIFRLPAPFPAIKRAESGIIKYNSTSVIKRYLGFKIIVFNCILYYFIPLKSDWLECFCAINYSISSYSISDCSYSIYVYTVQHALLS